MKILISGLFALVVLLSVGATDVSAEDSAVAPKVEDLALIVEAGDIYSAAKGVVRTYWDAHMRGDYEGAWKVVAGKTKARITKEQFVAWQKQIEEKKPYTITDVVIEDAKLQEGHIVVHITLKTMTPFGPGTEKTSGMVAKEDDRWGLLLSDSFINFANKHKPEQPPAKISPPEASPSEE